MKKLIASCLLISLLLITGLTLKAQGEDQSTAPRAPKWVSEKGYWVVESNIKTPYHSIIHFYNNDNVLVYREKVDGVKINLNQKRTKMKLKKILEQSVVAWENKQAMQDNAQLVAKALR